MIDLTSDSANDSSHGVVFTGNGSTGGASHGDCAAAHPAVGPEERLRLLIDAVQEYAILMLDPHGVVASWNKGAGRIKGYSADEIIGRHFSVFYTPEDVAAGKPQRELDAAIGSGQHSDEGWRVRKDGTTFWANVTITAVVDESGGLAGFVKVTRDETERRHALEQTQRLDRLLERETIARALGEGTVHRIFEAGLIVQGVLRLIDDPVATSRIEHAVEVLDEAVKEIRRVVIGLASPEGDPPPDA